MTSKQMTAGILCVAVAAVVMMLVIQTSNQSPQASSASITRNRVDRIRDEAAPSAARKPRWILLEERGWAGATSKDLSQADQAMLEKLAEIQADRKDGNLTTDQYAVAIRDLRARELKLLTIVNAHVFTDEMESNYWHRGRLKFPDPIEEASKSLDDE